MSENDAINAALRGSRSGDDGTELATTIRRYVAGEVDETGEPPRTPDFGAGQGQGQGVQPIPSDMNRKLRADALGIDEKYVP